MANTFQFDPIELPPECKELRQEVRAFLKQEIDAGTFSPGGGRSENAAAFARKVGAKGWIGMTWPKQYGGQGRTQLLGFIYQLFLAQGGQAAQLGADGPQVPSASDGNLASGGHVMPPAPPSAEPGGAKPKHGIHGHGVSAADRAQAAAQAGAEMDRANDEGRPGGDYEEAEGAGVIEWLGSFW